MISSKKIAIALITVLSIVSITPHTVMAEEIDAYTDDSSKIGETETTFMLSDESQDLDKQTLIDNQGAMSEGIDLSEGESMIIASDEEGIIYITCTQSLTSTTRASLQTSYKSYNIYKTILNVSTLLATVDLECTWCANGVDGYIQKLTGTYTEKNSSWHCAWDENSKSSTAYYHVLWLDITSSSSSYSIMLAASYSAVNSTLTFSIQ